MKIKYNKAKNIIKDGDVLLFRHGKFPSVGWWIGKYTKSPYSHVGLAHWENDKLYCVEFREFIGSRQYEMDKYIDEGAEIDVFRCVETVILPKILSENDKIELGYDVYEFDADVALKVIDTAKKFIGQKYSWWTIWQLSKTYMPIIRFRSNVTKNGKVKKESFVCSTLVNYAFRINFIDPIPFLSDSYTTPGDLARSPLFRKLFEIEK